MGFNFDGQQMFAIFIANANCIIKLIIRNKFRDKFYMSAQEANESNTREKKHRLELEI